MVQIARPDSTISAGSWTAINAATLHEAMDEVTPNDSTDYIEALNGANTTCEIGLSDLTDPVSALGHICRVTMQGTGSGGPERLTIELYDGATLIASKSNQSSRGSWGLKTLTLSETEANNITDYTDLRIKLISSSLGATEDMWVTQIEFEVPDAVVGDTVVVGQAVENDSGLPVTGLEVQVVGQAIETDSGLAVGKFFSITVSQANETDTGLVVAITEVVTVAQGIETDTAFTATVVEPFDPDPKFIIISDRSGKIMVADGDRKWILPGQIFTEDFAVSSTDTVTVGQAIETDTGLAVTGLEVQVVGQASETDTGLAVGKFFSITIGQASETDSGLSVSITEQVIPGQAIETDSGLPVTGLEVKTVGLATENSTAFVVSIDETVIVGLATSTEDGIAISATEQINIAQASETDSSFPVTLIDTVIVGRADSTDTALPVTLSGIIEVGLAIELDTALSVQGLQDEATGQIFYVRRKPGKRRVKIGTTDRFFKD